MILMSMSSSLRPMNGANFPPLLPSKCMLNLGPSTSKGQNSVLDGLLSCLLKTNSNGNH